MGATSSLSCATVRGNQIDGHELAVGSRMQFWRTLDGLMDAPSGRVSRSGSGLSLPIEKRVKR